MLDCEGLQYLHSVGLLRGSFHPPEAVAAVRTVLRHKASLVTTGHPYDETVLASDDQKTLARKTLRLKARAAALGYTLVPVEVSS